MFSTKELAIKLTTQNVPPIKVVTLQPNRVTRAEDRCPVKKAKAIPTESNHAKTSNTTSHMLLFFSFFLFQMTAITKMTSVCIFSKLFSLHFPGYRHGKFISNNKELL